MRKLVKLKREALGKTQKEVAQELELSPTHYRHIEEGHSNPGRKTMIKLSKYYNVPSEHLFPDLFF